MSFELGKDFTNYHRTVRFPSFLRNRPFIFPCSFDHLPIIHSEENFCLRHNSYLETSLHGNCEKYQSFVVASYIFLRPAFISCFCRDSAPFATNNASTRLCPPRCARIAPRGMQMNRYPGALYSTWNCRAIATKSH